MEGRFALAVIIREQRGDIARDRTFDDFSDRSGDFVDGVDVFCQRDRFGCDVVVDPVADGLDDEPLDDSLPQVRVIDRVNVRDSLLNDMEYRVVPRTVGDAFV